VVNGLSAYHFLANVYKEALAIIINMANGGVMAASVVLGFLVLIGMHWYYPQNALTQVVEEASVDSKATERFAMGGLISFSVGLLIEYFIIVLAIYFFLRSIIKSFERK
jgi:hypothetical protein